MAKYILCPRCELNYILENEQYCDVCKADLKLGPKLIFSTQDEDYNKTLCPICKTNYIDSEEYNCCEECRLSALRKDIQEPDVLDDENDESWRQYLDDDEKAEISNKGDKEESYLLSQIEEEEAFKDEMFDDEDDEDDDFVEKTKDDDDFVYEVNEADFEDDDWEDDEEDEEDDDFDEPVSKKNKK